MGLTGYSSGSLGVQSPSLSDLTRGRHSKKPKSTKAPARHQKRAEQSAESSHNASALEPTVSAQVAGILTNLQDIPAVDHSVPSPPAPPPVASLPQLTPAEPQDILLPQPSPVAPIPGTADPMDLLGFTLDELDDPEVMVSDD